MGQNKKIKENGFGQTKCTFKNEESIWFFESANLKKTYPFYMIAVFNDTTDFRLKIIDPKDPSYASLNATVSISDISIYDTFISLMAIKILSLKKECDLVSLTSFYSENFIKNSQYNLPVFLDKNFKVENPSFVSDSNTLESCLAQLYIFQCNKSPETLSYLEKNRSNFSKKMYDILKKTVSPPDV